MVRGQRRWPSRFGPVPRGVARGVERAGRARAAAEGDQPAEGGRKRSSPWSLLPPLAAGLGVTAVVVDPRLQSFLMYAVGVLALVSLTSAVLWGLAATDRLILSPVHRLVAQTVHRAMGVAAVVFLVLHVWMKLIMGQIGALAAFVPFADPARPLLLGLGTVAGYLFPAVALAGAARGRLARSGDARRWRVIHLVSYPAWGAGLVHGLQSGRLAPSWVVLLYGVAVVGVIVALTLRLLLQDRSGPRQVPVRLIPPEAGGPEVAVPRLPVVTSPEITVPRVPVAAGQAMAAGPGLAVGRGVAAGPGLAGIGLGRRRQDG
ncbi:ferric reductase-like transmembrane domain-containing protein [Kitasatospora sp. SUK 42]|uniref:ferric reductase-like transmembrane domain-containing protein n=1 Tax=Kitasatospora sp. SUK 42 TaxID=1588882 RepID=UPI0018CA2557|nr:ferric reductase-like transmembrane domain-containing protein [Kitasatospora sp. SUK 42]MBV2153233.1 ferric reductase-like transmembrane domain-containing protein [Kitasatospora sp. SUK 42]